MKRSSKLILLLLLSLLLSTSGLSKNIELRDINHNLEAIQVAAFKERKNIFYNKRDFSGYDTIMIKGENFYRYFVVNVKKNKLASILKKIRKHYPTAFKASYKIKKVLMDRADFQQKKVTLKSTKNDLEDWPSQKKKPAISSPYSRNLDSKTILQTRKKFF
jgi:hypothetical protein